jgi:hypothetical protein
MLLLTGWPYRCNYACTVLRHIRIEPKFCFWLHSSRMFHPSISGATAPSGSWFPSQYALILLCLLLVSSISVFLESMMSPYGLRPHIFFLVFLLVWYYEISHLEIFWDPFIFHSCITTPAHPSLLSRRFSLLNVTPC